MNDGGREELARMLAAAGLPATEADIEVQLQTIYPVMREAVEMLHAMPEAGEELPALSFDPDPSLEGWGDREDRR